MRHFASVLGLLVASCSPSSPSVPEALGRVRCVVALERAIESVPRLVPDKNVEHCGATLANPLVSTGTLAVENALVSLDWGGSVPSPSSQIELASRGCMLEPRIQMARTGDVLRVGSGDDITHNPHGWLDDEITVFNITVLDSSFSFERPLNRPGKYRIDCDTHKWMRAYIHVLDHPFGALTDSAGVAEFEAPVGGHTLTIWHELLGTRTLDVVVDEGKLTEIAVCLDVSDQRARRLVSPNEQPWRP